MKPLNDILDILSNKPYWTTPVCDNFDSTIWGEILDEVIDNLLGQILNKLSLNMTANTHTELLFKELADKITL
jgi:hypothetical protein